MNRRNVDERIVSNPAVMMGKPVIRGTRVPVYVIVDLIASGQTAEEIVADYPELTLEDVEAAAEFAAMEKERTEVRAL
jgi:uncharacterized protein (DUF433 family)